MDDEDHARQYSGAVRVDGYALLDPSPLKFRERASRPGDGTGKIRHRPASRSHFDPCPQGIRLEHTRRRRSPRARPEGIGQTNPSAVSPSLRDAFETPCSRKHDSRTGKERFRFTPPQNGPEGDTCHESDRTQGKKRTRIISRLVHHGSSIRHTKLSSTPRKSAFRRTVDSTGTHSRASLSADFAVDAARRLRARHACSPALDGPGRAGRFRAGGLRPPARKAVGVLNLLRPAATAPGGSCGARRG